MPAVDALTARTTLHEQLTSLWRFPEMVDAYASMDAPQWVNITAEQGKQRFGAAAMRRVLSVAETYYVSPDMHKLALRASEDFPTDEVILPQDLPSEAGFMYLPLPFRALELRGRIVVINAVLWFKGKMWAFTDRRDPNDEINRVLLDNYDDVSLTEAVNAFGQYDISSLVQYKFGAPVPKTVQFDKGVLPPDAKIETRPLPGGKTALYTDHVIDQRTQPFAQPDPLLLYMLAVWRLMQQTLASVHDANDVPRHARRRADRLHAPNGVTVIELRRREGEYETTGEGINYRTLVRGHWRRVWCGPKDGDRYQRAVYIHEFIRGPEDAPLIIRKRINALTR